MDQLTVGHAISEWKRIHGKNSDPRPILDRYFCGYIFLQDYRGEKDYIEMEEWCKNSFGEENYMRMFNRFWFTSDTELTMFRIVWAEYK
jgi:protoporphyrinogen oxidase